MRKTLRGHGPALRAVAAAALLVGAWLPAAAHAGSQRATLGIRVTVVDSCEIVRVEDRVDLASTCRTGPAAPVIVMPKRRPDPVMRPEWSKRNVAHRTRYIDLTY
ncbi:MAG: hypothetical protein R3C97_16365 [Geminicoccaceae bacterium]